MKNQYGRPSFFRGKGCKRHNSKEPKHKYGKHSRFEPSVLSESQQQKEHHHHDQHIVHDDLFRKPFKKHQRSSNNQWREDYSQGSMEHQSSFNKHQRKVNHVRMHQVHSFSPLYPYSSQFQLPPTPMMFEPEIKCEIVETQEKVGAFLPPQRLTGHSYEQLDSVYEYPYLRNVKKASIQSVCFGNIPNYAETMLQTYFSTQIQELEQEFAVELKCCLHHIVRDLKKQSSYFRKFIHEQVINLVNFGSFENPQHGNGYILMETSLNNSALLRGIVMHSYVEQKQKEHQFSQPRIQFYELLYSKTHIKYDAFEENIRERLSWLQAGTKQNQPKHSEEESCKNREQENPFKPIAEFILSEAIFDELIQSLIESGNDYVKDRTEPTFVRSQDAILKLILLIALKETLQQSFENEKPEDEGAFPNENAVKTCYYCNLLTKCSKITQFQENYFKRLSKHQGKFALYSCRSMPFFDQDDSQQINSLLNEEAGLRPSFYVHFFMELMNFVKSTFVLGISVEINEKSLCISSQRMLFKYLQPFQIAKTSKELESINPEFSKMLSLLAVSEKGSKTEAQFLFCVPDQQKREEHMKRFEQNIKFAKKVMIAIFTQILKVNQEKLTHVIGLCELSIDLQAGSQNLRTQYDHLLSIFNSLKNNQEQQSEEQSQSTSKQAFEISPNETDTFKLAQSLFILKISLISFTFYQLCFRQLGYGKFVALQSHLNKKTAPLVTIYRNLFSQNLLQTSSSKQIEEQTSTNSYSSQSSLNRIRRTDYYRKLKSLAGSLAVIKKGEDSGIHRVEEIQHIDEVLGLEGIGIEVHTELVDPERTVVFAELSPESVRELFFSLCLPRRDLVQKGMSKGEQTKEDEVKCEGPNIAQKQPELSKKNSENNQQQPLQSELKSDFASQDAERVIRTLVNRVMIAFRNATQKQIRVPLFLPRHFMIDNKLNTANYPNLVPRLNILQSFLDTNLSQGFHHANFVEEHYLNFEMSRLIHSVKEHNALVQATFLLSFTARQSELQFLKQVSKFIKLKAQTSSLSNRLEKIDFKEFYAYMAKNPTKDHHSFYLQKMCWKDCIQIFQSVLRQSFLNRPILSNRQNVVSYFFNEQEVNFLKLQQEYTSFYRSDGVIGNIFYSFQVNSPFLFFIKKHYVLPTLEYEDSIWSGDHDQPIILKNNNGEKYSKENAVRELLLLQHKNMCYLNSHPRHLFWSIQPVVSVKPFLHNQQMRSFVVIIQTQNFLYEPRHEYYDSYFGQDGDYLGEIIRKKSEYFYHLQRQDRGEFINKLLNIVVNEEKLGVQLLNIDVATVSFVPNEQLSIEVGRYIFGLEECSIDAAIKQSILLKPIFQELSVCRVFGSIQLCEENTQIYNRVYQSHPLDKDLSLDNDLNAYTYPPYIWRCIKGEETQFNYSQDIGSIGLVISLLMLDDSREVKGYSNMSTQRKIQYEFTHIRSLPKFLIEYRDKKQYLSRLIYKQIESKETINNFVRRICDKQLWQNIQSQIDRFCCFIRDYFRMFQDRQLNFLTNETLQLLILLIHPVSSCRADINDIIEQIRRELPI